MIDDIVKQMKLEQVILSLVDQSKPQVLFA